MPRGELEVIEYVPRQAELDAVSANHPQKSADLLSRLPLENRTLTSCAAALTAIALHILFVAPVLWTPGFSQHRQGRTLGAS